MIPARFIDALDRDGFRAVCWRDATGSWRERVVPCTDLVGTLDEHSDGDLWVSVATQREPGATRGRAGDVAGLSVLPIDLDVKPGAFSTVDDAVAAVEELATLIETWPAIVVHTGHGVQAWWVTDPDDEAWQSSGADDPRINILAGVVRRWGRLVDTVADRYGASADHVFDLARVMRVPGSVNRKSDPVPVTVIDEPAGWSPVSFDSLCERLDELGIPSGGDIARGAVASIDDVTARHVLDQMPGGDPCGCIARAVERARAAQSDRYNAHRTAVHSIVLSGREGCPGAVAALNDLRGSWLALSPSRGVSSWVAGSEWDRALSGSLAAAAGTPQGVVCRNSLDELVRRDPAGRDGAGAIQQSAAPVAPAVPSALTSDVFFGKDGLLVASLADAVRGGVPMRRDDGDRLWLYHGGVWRPDDHGFVRTRATTLLSERTRNSHTRNVEHYLLGQAERMIVEATPGVVNLRNGLLNLNTLSLHPHTPDVLSTTQLAHPWRPDATCPAIDAWLDQMLAADMLEPADHGSPGHIWEVIGYILTSGNPLQRAVLLLGPGANGKGTFLRLITDAIGQENIASVDLHSLVENRFAAATLFGKLANIAGDVDDGRLDSTAMFKKITGGDMVSAERKYGDPFQFTPFAVPVFSANKVFGTADTTDGYMRRWEVVPFSRVIPEDERDPRVELTLRTADELEGLIVKGIAGARALSARGSFLRPASVLEALDKFRQESDPVRAFIAQVTRPDPDGWIDRARFYEVYRVWASDCGVKPMGRNTLFQRTESAGIAFHKSRGTYGIEGVRLVASIEELGEHERTLEYEVAS